MKLHSYDITALPDELQPVARRIAQAEIIFASIDKRHNSARFYAAQKELGELYRFLMKACRRLNYVEIREKYFCKKAI